MSAVTYLKGVRTRYKNTLEREIDGSAEIIDSDMPINASEAQQQLTKCSVCLEKISTYKDKLQQQSENLCSKLSDDDDSEFINTVLEEDSEIVDLAIESYVKLQSHKDKLLSLKFETDEAPMKMESADSEIMTEIIQIQKDMKHLMAEQMKERKESKKEKVDSCNVKLPKLELSSFGGDKTKWYEFWDSFVCSVHENKTLSNVEKLSYLKGKLYGEARGAISGLSLTNENYGVAVGILKERFGNIQEVIKLHYDKLVSLPPATTKVSSLRYLIDNVNTHLRSLRVLGQDTDQDLFVSILWSKLPDEVLMQLQLKYGVRNKWSITNLLEMLHEYVVAKERIESESGNLKASDKFKKKEFKTQSESGYNKTSNQASVHALVAKPIKTNRGTKTNEEYKNKCRYCQKSHWSDECPSFRNIKERKEQLKNSCFRCLREGHKSVDCKSNKVCVYCSERNAHHRSLCPKKFSTRSTVTQCVNETVEQMQAENVVSGESALLSTNETVFMQTASTVVYNTETNTGSTARLFLDSGSQRTYITEKLCKKLDLKVTGEDTLNIVTFGSTKKQTVKTKKTKIKVKLKDGSSLEISANVVPVICGDIHRKPVECAMNSEIQHILQTVELADTFPTRPEQSTIEILIGNDFYLELILGQKIELHPGLYLLSSKLGWILSGRTKENNNGVDDINMLVLSPGSLALTNSSIQGIDAEIQKKPEIEDFWNVESIGIIDKNVTMDDKLAYDNFQETLKFEDNRYHVQWPWKEDCEELPENRELAMGRLKSSVNRLKTKPDLLKKYNDILEDQKDKGVIEKVERTAKKNKVHYIPHHAVITPQKSTTKVRVVYDASAKTKHENKSLNECLFRGPVLLHDLCGMLMRFRVHPIAIMADIEKAFLQIGLQEDQRDVTRFLWIKDLDKPTDKDNIQEYRFKRIPFGVISSPFLLGATVNFHLDSYQNSVADQLKSDIYVDNLITGCDSVSDGCSLYKDAKSMFNEASMNLREWVSNDKTVSKTFEEKDRVKSDSVSVLGHSWDTQNDTMSLKQLKVDPVGLPPTKRTVLQIVASLFDPLGLFSPVTLKGKLFIQYLWSKKIDWDEEIPSDQIELWETTAKDLQSVHQNAIPRCVSIANSEQEHGYTLACFCDASQKAYSCAIYFHDTCGLESKANLIFAKTRLAPVKKLSIPRLELMAVLIGVRCVTYVQLHLRKPIESVFLWTDSQCVLQWIHSDKPLDTFVKNRVTEIREKSENIVFEYVPTSQNPADTATRGLTVSELMTCEQWWKGPTWLQCSKNEWPRFEITANKENAEIQTCATENLQSHVHVSHEPEVNIKPEVNAEPEIDTEPEVSPGTIDINRFSSVTKLLRVTVYVLRFIRKCRGDRIKGPISSKEIENVEKIWIEHTQKRYLNEVIASINGKKSNSLQKQLGVFIDSNGILRCKGRLENAELTESAKQPILLPKSSKFTQLQIENVHKRLMHSGVAQTLSHVRQKYWIPHGRSAVKKVLNSCGVCRRQEGGPYKMPPMAPLPASRVSEATPFSNTGLDYMGPLYVKERGETTKVWVCVFTCMVTRAVHLEIVSDMSTNSFLNCLRRFIACRGTPKQIVCDNASHFKLASQATTLAWSDITKSDEVQSYTANKEIQWLFIVELAPWMGGFYERMVGLIKRSLRKAIGRKLLNCDQMHTFIKEVQSVVNSRPLVYVGDDLNSTIVITPSHFTTLNPYTGIPECEINEKDPDYKPVESSADNIMKLWKKGQKLLDSFWGIWRNEYLTGLRERTQSKLKSGRVQSNCVCKVGDVVLLRDNVPRGNWKLAKVMELITSADGCIRSAKVKSQSGRIMGRPLCLLYPIETTDVDIK